MAERFRVRLGRHWARHDLLSPLESWTGDIRAYMKEVMREYYRWTEHMDESMPEILKKALQPTFEYSQKIVPLDKTPLQKSGYLETRKFRGKTTVEMGYGKQGKPPYTIIQHENLEYKHDDGRQAKFLEKPLSEDADEIAAIILAEIRGASGV